LIVTLSSHSLYPLSLSLLWISPLDVQFSCRETGSWRSSTPRKITVALFAIICNIVEEPELQWMDIHLFTFFGRKTDGVLRRYALRMDSSRRKSEHLWIHLSNKSVYCVVDISVYNIVERSLDLFTSRQCSFHFRKYFELELRSVERDICLIAESFMTDSVIFQCVCVSETALFLLLV